MKLSIMREITIGMLLLSAFCKMLSGQSGVKVGQRAKHFLPKISWRPASVVSGEFTCKGQPQYAILGTMNSEIVIAVFLHGLNRRPEELHYSAMVRHADTAVLAVEDLDFDPKDALGYELEGFQRSRTCKGLNLSDGEMDSAHIFWNHKTHVFDDWSL